MSLSCSGQCYLILFITVVATAVDIPELAVDTSLNPRLVGAVYNLYKPTKPTKVQPIVIDCNHPSVVCRFGSSMIVTTNKECDCLQQPTGEVPIITGLATKENATNVGIVEKGGREPPASGDKDSVVPIYKGVVDTNAVLNEAERPYNVWNFQRNSADKGWRPSDDPSKKRIGELPAKFYSYYPFEQRKLPNFEDDDQYPEFPFDMSDDSRYIMWRKPGAHPSKPDQPNIPPSPSNPTTIITPKFTVMKSTSKPLVYSTPKRNVWDSSQ